MKPVQKDVGNIHRAACAILAGARLFQPAAATALGLSDEAAHADQAWLREGETPQAIYVTTTYPGGYWEDQGYNRFGGS